jgi:hypothetical protein
MRLFRALQPGTLNVEPLNLGNSIFKKSKPTSFSGLVIDNIDIDPYWGCVESKGIRLQQEENICINSKLLIRQLNSSFRPQRSGEPESRKGLANTGFPPSPE